MTPTFILLRIPRSAGATAMSGVLAVAGEVLVETGPDIPTVLDALLVAAGTRALELGPTTLIVPLDGRHGLAHVVLEESQKRGFAFTRHPPAGFAHLLLDLDGADGEPGLAAGGLSEAVGRLGDAAGEALGDSELGEAMAILRQIVTVCARHAGFWDANTLWGLANLVKVSASTGAGDNIREACELVRHALAQPAPAELPGAVRTLARLDELARNCASAGDAGTADQVLQAATDLARRTQGEDHPNHLATLNSYGLFLSARSDPRAEAVMRDLLGRARTLLGERHANVAVVLSNLAEFLENQGRAEEAAPLRAEAAAIRGA